MLPGRWRRFSARLRRRLPGVEYVVVTERQRGGRAHMHVLLRSGYLPWRWLRSAARDSGFGPVADIRRTPPRVDRYLTKSLADVASAPPRYFHRVRWSRNWAARSVWKAPRTWSRWQLVSARPGEAAAEAERRGFRVLEVVGGDLRRRVAHWVADRLLGGGA